MTKLKDVKKGDFFKRKENAKKVYIKGDFERSIKKYSCINFDDTNDEIFIDGNKLVFTDFDF